MNIQELLKTRNAGFLRLAFIHNYDCSLKSILQRFGLIAEPDRLHVINRAQALTAIESILWKDLAYGYEIMPRETARAYAEAFLTNYGSKEYTFYSNGDWTLDDQSSVRGWNPMTEATFDAGVVVVGSRSAACLWVEDED
ncbi:MAG: hypothetical protein KDD67_17710 [Ignavibacteriae bacterium]|nr:hypothetical protein [Ignavibacteriota bacterium]MCB9216858.1 hypothetical protein [Ignavibacteria bacterium]